MLVIFGESHAAPDLLVLSDDEGRYPLGVGLEVLDDSDAPVGIDLVSHSSFDTRFTASPSSDTRLGTGRSAWVRFALVDSSSDNQRDWLLEVALTYHETIELYVPTSAGGWQVWTAGCLLPFTAREIPHRNYLFDLPLQRGTGSVIYMRFAYEDRGVLAFPITVWDRDEFVDHDRSALIALGAFYGLILVMAAYHSLMFIPLRDSSYLYYVAFLLVTALLFSFQNGLAAEYLWPNSAFGWGLPDLVLLGLLYISGARFVQSFLLTADNARFFHRLLWVMVLAWGFVIIVGLAGYPGAFRPLARLSIASLIVMLLAGGICWLRGFRPARFFLIGWAVPVAAGLVMNLVDIQVFSGGSSMIHVTQAGIAFGVVMFSLGLTDRITLLRLEKERHALREHALEHELNTAHELQMSLMPTDQLHTAGIDVYGRCQPATHVGGDLFYYFVVENSIGVCLADVTGHAMEAAIPVVKFSGLLEAECQRYNSLEDTFTSLNSTLHKTRKDHSFVCFEMVEVDIPSRSFRVCNAGCPYAYHFRAADSKVVAIELDAYPLGIRASTVYPTTMSQLSAGDRIIICSDGVSETQGDDGELLGYERLPELILKACLNQQPAASVVAQILDETGEFRGTQAQTDDITCVVLGVSEGDSLGDGEEP